MTEFSWLMRDFGLSFTQVALTSVPRPTEGSGFVYSGIDSGLALAPVAFGVLMDAGRYSGVLRGVAALQRLAIVMALAVGFRARARSPS